MTEAVLSLLEMVAMALPAYALVLQTIANQSVRYPPEAVDGLSAAMAMILLSGMVLVSWLIYDGLPLAVSLGAAMVALSFVAMLYATYHFRERQEELEETPDDEGDDDEKNLDSGE